MKRIQIVAALLFVLSAVPLLAQVSDTYVIPAAASAQGGFGTFWKTRVSIFNPQVDRPLTVNIVYLPTPGQNGTGVTGKATVPANSIAATDDILADLGVSNSTGALLFYTDTPSDPVARSFLVTSDTYNDQGRAGTYGQTVPGVFATGLQDDGLTGVVHGLTNDDSLGWRTNLGAVNLGRCSVSLLVTVYDVNGRTVLNKQPMDLPPLAYLQERLPVTVRDASVELAISDPCGNDSSKRASVFAYSSMIDNLSGDPSYQSPVLLATPNQIYVLKAAGKRELTTITNERAREIGATLRSVGFVTLTKKADR